MSGFKVKSSLKLALGAEINRRKAEESDKQQQPSASGSSSAYKRSKRIDPAPKANKGVKRRFAADLAAQPTAEELAQSHNRKSALERKAELYERLKRGDTAGLTPGQRASLGVDFDRKVQQEWDRRDEEQEEESEEKSVSSGGSDDEESNPTRPRVEVTDDLGRTRYVKPSRAHKYKIGGPSEAAAAEPALQHTEDGDYADYSQAIYGAQEEFPVYEPTPEELRERQESLREEPLWKHYDPSSEVRDAGGARYKFSSDENERRAQQEAIKNARFQSEAEVAAENKREQVEQGKLDKRRQEIAERKRKLLEAREKQASQKRAKTASSSGQAGP